MSNEPWFKSFVLIKAMACVPHRKASRDKEPDDVGSVDYLALVKLHVSKESLDKAFDGEGLFNRKACPDVKDNILNNSDSGVLLCARAIVF